MCDCSDRLHFNGVHLLQWVVQDTGGINGLESQVLVVEMSNEQTFRGERIGLNIDIGSGNTLQEAGLSNIGVSANEQGSGIGINRRETTKMLSDLIEVEKGIFQSSANGGHSSQSGTLKLLALEERLGIFEEAHIIARHDFDQVLCGGELAKRYPEMVGVVEGIEEIFVERVDILQSGESVEDQGELLAERLLCEFDLSSVKI